MKKNVLIDKLPVGIHQFSKIKMLNYRLMNALYSLGFAEINELKQAGKKIKRLKDTPTIFSELAKKAENENRYLNAAGYYRAAEFFVSPDNPLKKMLYNKFSINFSKVIKGSKVEHHEVPYENSFLSAYVLMPEIESPKGTILIHGGFDSFIEIFYAFWQRYVQAGYKVIAFDGPGQGATLNKYGVPLTHYWEDPVGAILDHFNEKEVALHGFSFGGYWCVRAAAFEKRIKRLIVHAPFYDYMELASPFVKKAVHWMMKHDWLLNPSISMRTKLFPMLKHVVQQARHVTKNYQAKPRLAADLILQMNKEFLHSELIDQDVLLLAGARDTFQPVKLHKRQKQALVNAKSVTERIFTEEESAASHCQIGNVDLLMDVIINWLKKQL